MSKLDHIGKHKTKVFKSIKSVKYHETEIFRESEGIIYLNCGGWYSATTALRMNQALKYFNRPALGVSRKGGQYIVREFKAGDYREVGRFTSKIELFYCDVMGGYVQFNRQ